MLSFMEVEGTRPFREGPYVLPAPHLSFFFVSVSCLPVSFFTAGQSDPQPAGNAPVPPNTCKPHLTLNTR